MDFYASDHVKVFLIYFFSPSKETLATVLATVLALPLPGRTIPRSLDDKMCCRRRSFRLLHSEYHYIGQCRSRPQHSTPSRPRGGRPWSKFSLFRHPAQTAPDVPDVWLPHFKTLFLLFYLLSLTYSRPEISNAVSMS